MNLIFQSDNKKKQVVITYNPYNGYKAAYEQIFFNGLENEKQLLDFKIFSTEKKAVSWAKKLLNTNGISGINTTKSRLI